MDRDEDLGERQQRFQREEMRTALRALLMTPLMDAAHEDFAAVRRHADGLREWFARETGWVLHVERDGARLYKRPADLTDATRGMPGYDRRRYALLCLACAVLERADPQITLRLLGERLLDLAADPALAALGFTFTLGARQERRELVVVCRTLLALGVLQHVAGDEEAFVLAAGTEGHADALYDVHRRTLAGMLAAVRGPSSWSKAEAPTSIMERLRALADEPAADSDEGRRVTMRHHVARRLLDDPVVYSERLATEVRAYFLNQRGAMASRLSEASGLVAEQRAEGLALVDESGLLTDLAMPAEGTDAHVTLLTADYLATRQRQARAASGDAAPSAAVREQDIAEFLRDVRERYGRYWRKSARTPGAERELAAIAVERLEKLQLVERLADFVHPLPALARFALGDVDVQAMPR